jgi:tetratricopeptide (TPR) repeat protein
MKPLIKISVLFFLAAGMVATLELSLRLLDYGYDTAYVTPKTTPAGPKAVLNPCALLLSSTIGTINSNNEPFLNLSVDKPAGNLRVVVLGGSAAYGAYIVPDASFARYLELMLSTRFPDRKIDVINLAFPSLNSGSMVRALQDALLLKPDIVVCYEAYNDLGRAVVIRGKGLFFSRIVFPLEEMTMILKRMKVYQLAVNLCGCPVKKVLSYFVKGVHNDCYSFQSMTAEENDLLTAVFRDNMETITSICREKDIPVFLCTYACNMKNLRAADPFAHTRPEEIAAALFLLRQAYALEISGDYRSAISSYQRFHDRFPQFPDPLCHMAFCYYALDMPREAVFWYEKARALSDGALEKIEALNMVLREMAALSSEDKIFLVDIAEAFKKSSPLGFMPGEEYFIDRIHFTSRGSYELAGNLYRALAIFIAGGAAHPPPSKSKCDSRLGLAYLIREREYAGAELSPAGLSTLLGRPMISYALMQDVIREYRSKLPAEYIVPPGGDQTIPEHPDFYFYKNMISGLIMGGEQSAALALAARLAEATGRHSLALVLYGQTLLINNQPEAALEVLKEAMGQPARAFDLKLRLSAAETTLRLGRTEESVAMLEAGWRMIQNWSPVIVFDEMFVAGIQERYLSVMNNARNFSAKPVARE